MGCPPPKKGAENRWYPLLQGGIKRVKKTVEKVVEKVPNLGSEMGSKK